MPSQKDALVAQGRESPLGRRSSPPSHGAQTMAKEGVVTQAGSGSSGRWSGGAPGSSYRLASLIALLVLVVVVVGLKLDIGLTALALAFVLQAVFRPPENEIFRGVAWSVVLLLAGLLIYLDLLSKLGTLHSIQHGLHTIGSPVITLLALAYITALFSNMDSSTIVVLGVMAPIGLSLTNGSLSEVLAVLVVVATATAVISMSPVHIDGSLIIANTPDNDEPRLFRKLIYLSVIVTIVVPVAIAIYPILMGV